MKYYYYFAIITIIDVIYLHREHVKVCWSHYLIDFTLRNLHQSFSCEGSAENIGEWLVRDKKLQQADFERALLVNSNNGNGIGPLLVRLGLVSDKDLTAAYAKHYDLPVLEDDELPDAPTDNYSWPYRFLKSANAVPIGETADRICIAVSDPEDDFTIKAMEMACGKPASIWLATLTQVERTLDKLYGNGRTAMEGIVEDIRAEADAVPVDSVERLRDLAAEAPVIRLVNLIINRALSLRASDVHIEPFENQLKVRYRIDGMLQAGEAPPVHSTAAVVSRIKIMAKLNIAERRLPQDGRIQLRIQGRLIDLRVSTVPTLHGESLVLRILDRSGTALDMESLGFDAADIQRFCDILALPHGIILVTGPTGSGKTTTLYAALQTLNIPDRKILTVEDPVEYQLEGINQIQVKPQIGLNFADALRAIVRQDPDIIMIGEMRDLETARIAVQSALTGHLVLSTLHTNDAGSSITRLLDMGVEDYLLTSTLNGILAQRLVRTLCAACRVAYRPPQTLLDELQRWLIPREHFDARHDLLSALHNDSSPDMESPDKIVLYKAIGCEACAQTGYLGRTVISELLVLSESIRELILSGADGNRIQDAAINAGMDSIKIDGLRKALQGVTTIEEVSRVTQV